MKRVCFLGKESWVKSINRCRCWNAVAVVSLTLILFCVSARAMECQVQHPFKPPQSHYSGQCPVCGMVRAMWARTWITFDPVGKVSQVCSFHCLADWTVKSGQEPAGVMIALYHRPEKVVPAAEAVIVMGSVAAGTMSPVSKIVFADRPGAERFAGTCGGEVVAYGAALQAAKASVKKENQMIQARRLQKGKIIEPAENDTCAVCEMYPMRYPHGKCQIRTNTGQALHFCSTQCLFAFLGNQPIYTDNPLEPLLVWVVDRDSGMWISGKAAFYVLGSTQVLGPMGYEALPFALRKKATDFAAQSGGSVAFFDEVSIWKIVPNWQYPKQH